MISLFPASTHSSHLAGVGPLERFRNAQANFLVRRSFGESGRSIKFNGDVRQYAAEKGITKENTLAKGMEEKSKEVTQAGGAGLCGGVELAPF